MSEGSALLLIDLDHFKLINDKYGHYSGDYVLTEVAEILTSIFSGVGFAGRVGGDEFAVLISERCSEASISQLCEKSLDEARRISFQFDGSFVNPVRFSMGCSFAKDGQSFEELYQDSDEMLYVVKENGRNGYKIRPFSI